MSWAPKRRNCDELPEKGNCNVLGTREGELLKVTRKNHANW